MSAHFDMGSIAVGNHWINPYIGIKIPRASTSLKGNSSTILGFLFHHQRGLTSRLRSQLEFTFTESELAKAEDKKVRTDIGFKANVSYANSNFVFGLFENWNLTSSLNRESKVSAAGRLDNISGYAQVDLKDKWAPSLVTLGAGYKVHKDVTVYVQGIQDLEKVEVKKSEGAAAKEPIGTTFKKPDVSIGVDYKHCSGFATKLAYNLKGKVSSNLMFNVNKYFTGSLLFDVS